MSVSVTEDLDLHFVIVLNPNTQHSVLWFKCDAETKNLIFENFKKIARSVGDDLLICDGQLYQYDHGNAKWLKQRWENVIFEQE